VPGDVDHVADPGVLGVYPGKEVPKGSGKAGNICIRNPWPGSFQTIWGSKSGFG
jgi:acetyl-CoA synthetase